MLTLPPEVLAKLWPLNPLVQPRFWCWNDFWLFMSRKFPYLIKLFANNGQVEIASEERVALPNHHHSILVVRHEKNQVVLLW